VFRDGSNGFCGNRVRPPPSHRRRVCSVYSFVHLLEDIFGVTTKTTRAFVTLMSNVTSDRLDVTYPRQRFTGDDCVRTVRDRVTAHSCRFGRVSFCKKNKKTKHFHRPYRPTSDCFKIFDWNSENTMVGIGIRLLSGREVLFFVFVFFKFSQSRQRFAW